MQKEVKANIGGDKLERAEQCLEYLNQEKGIKICNLESDREVATKSDIAGIGISSNIAFEHRKDFCLEEFLKKGFVSCDLLDSYKVIMPVLQVAPASDGANFKAAAESSAAILQVHYDGGEIVAIPNTPGDDTISIGKATKLNGKEINGCKFVVRDFFEGKAILDFSNFPEATFEDLFITNIKMNELATKAIHLADVSPEYLVCLYNYSGSLIEDSFIFNSQENMHA
ncbi:hypothetical protein I862_03460 [endosymbiont of Acanthamoeba sp. UWC8]|uniref:hypothetical protein n=1 Tax=endosymbiont of Acanthamoeba sp. UWC8 TaxID=86106 RepID=UPI0004D11CF4|nr:hypothetical protein [endosymbiont of Acanthamoeba sp. UWC8]AIF81252.1 hypothetical protein I862_03460 [endosymbiont of Acanthamoeba sp. UWC8]